jgi:hypothetical protein
MAGIYGITTAEMQERVKNINLVNNAFSYNMTLLKSIRNSLKPVVKKENNFLYKHKYIHIAHRVKKNLTSSYHHIFPTLPSKSYFHPS